MRLTKERSMRLTEFSRLTTYIFKEHEDSCRIVENRGRSVFWLKGGVNNRNRRSLDDLSSEDFPFTVLSPAAINHEEKEVPSMLSRAARELFAFRFAGL